MELSEYCALDATALRELIRTGQVNAAEVETAARQAIESVNGDLNALTQPLFQSALDHDPDGPIGGVPFLVKDSGPFARGVTFTLGSRSIRGAVAAVDHELMTRFRAAGLATLGQTTAPELGLSYATESLRYGRTRNPWALERGVGGSSGGAAALVAAGAVPLAHGNDGGGSVRIPASACGLVGLKVSRGRTPSGPLAGEAGFGLIAEFGLTRSIRDTALLLECVSGPAVGEKYTLSSPDVRYTEVLRADPGRLRVAVTTDAWSGVPVDLQVAGVAAEAARTLEWIGHSVSPATPGIQPDDIVEGSMLAAVATGAALLRAPVRPDPGRLEAVSRALLAETLAFTALDVMAALDAQNRLTRAVGTFFTEYDLLVTPTLAQLPARHGELDYDDPGYSMRDWLRRIYQYGPFTAAFNVSGNPAISLPLGQSREGLPIGVQLVAATGREDLLLQVAAQLEQAQPWAGRQPSVFAG
ncbi:amidase [Glaciibacter sp. 2TAF33]|uniref:amidase n=1 Tax=Glaciibacter sp. 2TAF33 TaxID=3233015 RepID=UPI003F8EE3C0